MGQSTFGRVVNVTDIGSFKLTLRGNKETIGQPSSGIVLVIIDLLSKYITLGNPVTNGTGFPARHHPRILIKVEEEMY